MFIAQYGLTEAVLSGRKTQTRRIIPKSTLEKVDKFMVDYCNETFDVLTEIEALQQYFFIENVGKLPFKVGEIVAVAQSYKDCGYDPNALDRSPKDLNVVRGTLGESKGWNNKMFVRSDACKHHIRITNVRVKRLQDISDEDCMAEGVCKWTKDRELFKYDMADGFEMFEWRDKPRTPREAYAALIDRISGKGTWDSNPYVFVYDFELVEVFNYRKKNGTT